MKIVEVKENKKQYLDLLLLADEQEDMIDRYLDVYKRQDVVKVVVLEVDEKKKRISLSMKQA